MCFTLCGKFVTVEGDIAGARLTEFGANIPQSGECGLQEWIFKHDLVIVTTTY